MNQGFFIIPFIQISTCQQTLYCIIIQTQVTVLQEIIVESSLNTISQDRVIFSQQISSICQVIDHIIHKACSAQLRSNFKSELLIIRNGKRQRIYAINWTEQSEQVKMQHRTQSQRFTLADSIIVIRQYFPIFITILDQQIGIGNQFVSSTPNALQITFHC